MRAAVVAVIALAILALAGRAPTTARQSPLDVVLVLDRTAYEPGTPIAFTIHVTNLTNQPVTVTFTSTQRFDLSIQSDAIEAARWSNTQTFQAATVQQTWAPGEVVVYTGAWLPMSTLLPAINSAGGGQFISRGTFRMYAQLTAVDPRPVSRPEILIIGAPVPLAAGCTTLTPSLPVELPVSTIVRAIDPPSALQSLWQRSVLFGEFMAYQPTPQIANNLTTINRRNPLTVCLTEPARIILP